MATNGGFGFFDRRWVRRGKAGEFELALPEGVEALLVNLLGQLEELLATDASVTWRLFPTAYPDNAQAEQEFQDLVRDDLVQQQRDAAKLVISTLQHETLTEDEVSAWMRSTNSLRLVLGTILDVSEEEPLVVEPAYPLAAMVSAYEVLGHLVDQIVTALREVG